MAISNVSQDLSATPTNASSWRTLWQVPTFLLGLAALCAVWLVRPLWYDPEAWDFKRHLRQARESLEQTNPDPEIVLILEQTLHSLHRFPSREGEVHFLLGSALSRQAKQLQGGRAEQVWREARAHLEKAYQVTVPPADTGQLVFRLGLSMAMTQGPPEQIIQFLSQGIDQGVEDRFDGYAALTQAYLRLPTPNLKAALDANEKQLLLPVQDERSLAPYRLLRGELYLRQSDRESARRVLARIGPESEPTILARARILRASSFQDEDRWSEAARIWEQVLADTRFPTDQDSVRYWLGWCYRNMAQPELAAKTWQPLLQTPGPIGQAVRLRLARLRSESGQTAEALGLYQVALQDVAKPADYFNRLIDLPQLLRQLEKDCELARKANQFAYAQQIAILHARLASKMAGQGLLGQVAEAWGNAQLDAARKLENPQLAQKEEAQARGHYREAGLAYESAAEAAGFPITDRANFLWRAGWNLQEGQEPARAAQVLEQFVKLPIPHDHRGEAWYRLGITYLILKEAAKADAAFKECIQHDGPFAFRARFQQALAMKQANRLEEAEQALTQNLSAMIANVDPDAKEKSLYALAEVLYDRGNLSAASNRWEQALNEFPTNPGALNARYLYARCCEKLAELEKQNVRQQKAWIDKAVVQCHLVVDELQTRRAKRLSDAESTLLRKAHFELAECHFNGGNWPAAFAVYEELAHRYAPPADVYGLQALKRIYLTHQVLASSEPSHLNDMRATLKRIRAHLEHLVNQNFRDKPEMDLDSIEAWESWVKQRESELDALKIDLPMNKANP